MDSTRAKVSANTFRRLTPWQSADSGRLSKGVNSNTRLACASGCDKDGRIMPKVLCWSALTHVLQADLWLTRTGIWLSSAENRPFATIVGSSNYGPRSAKRDIEVNALVMTKNKALQEQLKAEVEHIQKDAVTVNDDTFEQEDRKVGWGVRLAAWLIKDML